VRLAAVESAARTRGDHRLVLRCIETRLKMFRMIGPNVVVQQNVQVNWDEIRGAVKAAEVDAIEERLAQEVRNGQQ
jgi:hypothetical protein